MAKKPTEFTPGLFGFDVPVDKGASLSENKKPKAWESDENDNPMVLAYGRHQDRDLRCRDCDLLYLSNSQRSTLSAPTGAIPVVRLQTIVNTGQHVLSWNHWMKKNHTRYYEKT